MHHLLHMYNELCMALLVSSAEPKLNIMKAVHCPLKWRSTGLIHRARMIDLGARSLVASTSSVDSWEGWNPMGTFLTTHVYSLSLISDMALKPCMNSMCTPSFLIYVADLGEFMLKRMSPLVSVFAPMNCMPSGMSSWVDFI